MYTKIIVNPKALRVRYNKRKINSIEKHVAKYSKYIETIFTTLDYQEKKTILNGISKTNRIIIIGGDGTINRVINYLLDENIVKPLGIIPTGTSNVFAKEMKIPLNSKKAIDIIFNGEKTYLDIGKVTNKGKIHYFLLMAGIGFDAQTTMDTSLNIKHLGELGYVLTGFKNMINYKPEKISVKINDNEIIYGNNIIISNSKLYGGRITIAPNASMKDGFFDMCAFQTKNNIKILKHVVDIAQKRHIFNKEVIYEKSNFFKITSTSENQIPFQLDGEAIGYLPIIIEVLNKKLPIILKKQVGNDL